jgi:hypothetical protein
MNVEDLGDILATSMIGRLKDRGVTPDEASSIHDSAVKAVNDAWPSLKSRCCEAISGLQNAGCTDRELMSIVVQGYFKVAGIEIADGLYSKHISHTRN